MAFPITDSYSVVSGAPVWAGRYPSGLLSGGASLGDVSATGVMASQVSELSGSMPLGGVTAGGGLQGALPESYQVVADGIWTWFTDPRAVFYNGATYVGYIASTGRPGIAKYTHATNLSESFVLTGTFQSDDHDNCAVYIRADGRIVVCYSKHNDSDGTRYRISTNPEDISSWATEVVIDVGSLAAYSTLHHLSANGKFYWHFRRDLQQQWAISTTDFSTWDAERAWIVNGSQRPYVKACNNGVDRIDFVFTTGHPNQTTNSLYHCYMQLDAGVEKFYRSDGTYISTGSVTPAQATLIYDGTTAAGETWSWEIDYGADGRPRVLFARFPTTTDHRYVYGRWSGSAWQVYDITDGGPYLYAAEANYSGGLCFDAHSTDDIYLSRHNGTTWEIEHWRTADEGATWAKRRDITSGSASGLVNARPYSPRNHDGRAACVWWAGTYTSFTSYNTAVRAIGEY